MDVIIKKYLLDFWVWWYWFFAKRVFHEAKTDWVFTLGALNIVPMATNLFTPMFKDKSWEGRLVAFPIRLTWVLVSSVVLILYSALVLVGILCYFLVPLAPIAVIIYSFYPKS